MLHSKRSIVPMVQMASVAGLILAIGFWSFMHGQLSALAAGISIVVLLGFFRLTPQLGITAALIFLAVLGDLRRIISGIFGFGAFDPLVLVGTAFAFLIAGPMLVRVKLVDAPSRAIYFLMIVQILQIFNPGQGGLGVGVSGFILLGGPLFWYWIGRKWGTEAIARSLMYRIIIVLGVIAAAFGYYQTLFGVLPWQKPWIEHLIATTGSIGALSVGGSGVRPFGYSTISSEYINLLVFAVTFCVGGVMTGRKFLWIPFAALAPALILASSRGAILRILIFTAIAWALKGKTAATRTSRFVFALVFAFGGLAFVLSRVGDVKVSGSNASQAQYALAHNVNGLSHPLDANSSSTAGLHGEEIWSGLLRGLRRPIGYGVGSTTEAAGKFGEAGFGTEFDLSDAFIGLGIPGGLLFLTVTWQIFAVGFRYSRSAPVDIGLPLAALLLPTLGNWIFQGEYLSGPFFWVLMGTMVKLWVRGRTPKPANVVGHETRPSTFPNKRTEEWA